MSKIKIKNFGPIIKGYKNNGCSDFININKVTVFIGPQGSGKSTLAKLVSCFTWIEKSLVKGAILEEKFNYKDFKKQLQFNQIDEYLTDSSYLEWIGENFTIICKNSEISIIPLSTETADIPKIMYIPAERNFLSSFSFSYIQLVSVLTLSLKTFLEEYTNAKKNIKGEIRLPIAGISCEYERSKDVMWIKRGGNKTRLEKSASGFQSITPLFLVSENLSNLVQKGNQGELNFSDYERLKSDMRTLLQNTQNNDSKVLDLMIKELGAKFFPSYFFNIVEEPEQNLFPESQKELLFYLLKCVNKNKKNKLLITTHSPYLLGYLNCCIFGKKLQKHGLVDEKMNTIIPISSLIDSENVIVYQLDNSGNIECVEPYEGLIADGHILNTILNEPNEMFYELLSLEGSIQ